VGRDGKEKLSSELRVYCLQVVDDILGNKYVFCIVHCDTYSISSPFRPELLSEQDLLSLHQAMMSYIQTEFVEGSAELGLACKSRSFWRASVSV
jgi:hypothetical protein